MLWLKKLLFNKSTLWLIAISAFVVLYGLISITVFTQDSFQEYLLSISPNSLQSIITLLSILLGLSCIGMPRQVVAFTCGYFFGIALGLVYATLTVTIAAAITYQIASLFQQSYIANKYKNQLTKLNNFLSVDTFLKALVIRLLPVGSNFLTNILAGIANIPLLPYIAGSCLGFIPQMAIFSLAGSGVKLADSTHISVAAVLFLIATLIGYYLYKARKSELN